MHDRRPLAVGHRCGEPRDDVLDTGQLAATGLRELAGPPTYLPRQISLRATEVGQPHVGRNDPVQLGQNVDQCVR